MIQIQQKPNLSVEPSHQELILPASLEGCALARLLTGTNFAAEFIGDDLLLHIPHDVNVDANIVELINQLADVRFHSPTLLQMTLEETTQ